MRWCAGLSLRSFKISRDLRFNGSLEEKKKVVPSLHRADSRAAQVDSSAAAVSRLSAQRQCPSPRVSTGVSGASADPSRNITIITGSGHLSASVHRLRRWYLANEEPQSCPSPWRYLERSCCSPSLPRTVRNGLSSVKNVCPSHPSEHVVFKVIFAHIFAHLGEF